MIRNILACLFALWAAQASAHEYQAGDLKIVHPNIVETPLGAEVASGYVTVINSGGVADKLLGIESELKVEMHVTKVVDDIASMTPLTDGLEIPPGAEVGLGKNGTHAMFMGLGKQLKEGDKLDAVLIFEKAGRVKVVFNVEKRGASAMGKHDSH